MTKYPPKSLSIFRQNQKFESNGRIYTVFQIEGQMAEVFDGIRFYAWPTWSKVTPITLD